MEPHLATDPARTARAGATPVNGYASTFRFQRTEAERRDPIASWDRSDRAFFASGACHVLAFALVERRLPAPTELIFIQPRDAARGTHLYALVDGWAFDAGGWTHEAELLETTQQEWRSSTPTWSFDRIPIHTDLRTFCRVRDARLPEDFAHSPWPRAHAYLDQFPLQPPASQG